MSRRPRERIGLIPAAGRASRLGGIAGSKEIVILGWRATPQGRRPILACENLLTAMRLAGCERALVLRREEKRDIEHALGDGSAFGLPLEHVVVPTTGSVPETLAQGLRRIGDADVVLGFPDVLAEPPIGLRDAVSRRAETGADVVLALYPTDRPHKCDMVELDAGGAVRRIEVKPARTALQLTWLHATWGPRFSEILRDGAAGRGGRQGRELAISDLLVAGLRLGLRIEAVTVADGRHLDIGTPDDLARARARFSGATEPG